MVLEEAGMLVQLAVIIQALTELQIQAAAEGLVFMRPAQLLVVTVAQVSSSLRSINKRSHEEDHEVLRH